MALFSMLALALVTGAAPAPRNETAVQTLHRKGVHCMEVLERQECAISNFEAVLDERTSERALVTDALLRLVKIYKKAADQEGLANAVRRYWDVGMARKSTGHIAYSTRYFSAELDVLWSLDIQQARSAPVLERSGEHSAEFIFTCDPERRNNIKLTERWRRAEVRAAREGKLAHQIIYEDMDRKRARRGSKSRSFSPGKRPDGEPAEPIFSLVTCELAKAFGQEDLLSWRRMGGAMSHQNFSRSMGVVEVPNLDELLAAAVAAKTVRALAPNRWVLVDVEYAEQPVHLLKLDRDELVIAREDMAEAVVSAAAARRRTINRDIQKLVGEVPRDSGFLVVLNRAAIVGLSFSGMKEGKAGFLQALLPKPKGLQVAGSFGEYAGFFTRVPTDNPVKAKMLVGLARRLLEANDDPGSDDFMSNFDIAEASDRKALVATYILASHQLADILYN